MNWLTKEIPPAWQDLAHAAMHSPAWSALGTFLQAEIAAGHEIYPPRQNWFAALQGLAPQDVRVVIVGQDPYHGEGEAHGLSFSVPRGIRIPPSLANIYKEIARDLGHAPARHGCLESWAAQGVLLLNTSLTVRANQAGSHAKKGWEAFTDALIAGLSREYEHRVFLLWGAHAQKKRALIDANRHLILESPHPSPLSAHRGFIGNGHFSATNTYLEQHGQSPIDWRID
ncbi:Uracil-DNA glycosylase [Formivibrio citricus]|uniref:Uracil-DNA glycosylase n=1 Tax=Formivibrio citricus TaxID=83765 RepID=A0A1I4X8M9_9NEIS|nr:uracil-DNA glycosylase [Formivibrio citricus]SFN22065.1 Uracil-DNA glycosylase [Formivibrio citricus]